MKRDLAQMTAANKMTELFPITPDTVTVLGDRWKADSPAWPGLLFNHPAVAVRAGSIWGADDMHLGVPFVHPEDSAHGRKWEDDQIIYRVRARANPGRKWRGRKVAAVSFVEHDGKWCISVEWAPSVL